MRNYLKYQHPGIQFMIFIGLAAAMLVLYGVILQNFFGEVTKALSIPGAEISEETLRQFKWAQFLSALISFIIPSLVFAALSDEKPLQYMGLKRNVSVPILLMVAFLLIAAEPVAVYMGQLNEQVNFGRWQEGLQRTEALYESAMKSFVRMNSSKDLLVNLFVIAFVPAVGEELFFRGSLQNILERWIRVPGLAIFFSSFVFAFLHSTPFHFLAIFTLGVVLGTIFYITRNLWYSIFFHFLNNSIMILITYYAARNETLKKLSGDEYKVSGFTALVSLLITIAIFFFIRRRSPNQPIIIRPHSAHFDIE